MVGLRPSLKIWDRLPQPHSYLLVEHQQIGKTIYMIQNFLKHLLAGRADSIDRF